MSDSLIDVTFNDVHYAKEGNRLLRMGQRKAMGEKLCLENGQILTDDHIRNFYKTLEPLKLNSVIAPLPNNELKMDTSQESTDRDVELTRSYDRHFHPYPYLKLL